jgi:hypothetical protein
MIKNRKLPLVNYLKELQYEYVENHIRGLIYPKVGDRAYFERVKQGKRGVIQDVARKCKQPTLFDCMNTNLAVWGMVEGSFGFPNFIYKTDHQRDKFKTRDLLYYYCPDSAVTVLIGDEKRQGTILDVDYDNRVAFVDFDGKELAGWFTFDYITRTFAQA